MDARKALAEAKAALEASKLKRLQATTQSKPATSTKGGISELAKKSLRKWGAKSFDDLMKVNTGDKKKFGYIPPEEREALKSFKEAVDTAVLMSHVFKKPVTELKFFNEELQFHMKAFGIDSGDEGFEWIPTGVADSYLDEFNLDRKVSGLFTEVKMPTNPYKWPVLSGGAIARKVGEVSAIAGQSFKTNSTITFDAEKLQNFYPLPEELNEDSAVDMVKVIRQELIEGQEKALEIAILEGDADGTHQHHFSQLPDVAPGTLTSAVTDSPEHIFDGLRKRAMAGTAKVDAGGNAITEAEMSQLRGKMGKFGVDPSGLAVISGPIVYNQLLQLDDVRTLEQYGAQATVLTGELAKYEGISVIVSEYLREDLAATGFNTVGGPNTTGSLLMVNRKRYFVGTKRAITVLVEKNRTQYDVLDMVSYSRKAFQGVAGETNVGVIYNVGL